MMHNKAVAAYEGGLVRSGVEENWLSLASAIIELAAEDYFDNILVTHGVPVFIGTNNARVSGMSTAKSFFDSDWFVELYPGNVDKEQFIKKLNSDGMYNHCLKEYSSALYAYNTTTSKDRKWDAETTLNALAKFFDSEWWMENVGIYKDDVIKQAHYLYQERLNMNRTTRKSQTL